MECAAAAGREPQGAARRDRGLHLRQPVAGAVGRRRHRHQRQDVVHAVDRAMPRSLRSPSRDLRHARQRPRRRAGARDRTRRRTRRGCTRCSPAYKAAGARAIAIEVSSHGLDQGRVNGVAFDIAMFTNLTRDHLDYHGTMAAYGAAKAKLFAWPDLQRAGDQRRRCVRAEPCRRAPARAAGRCSPTVSRTPMSPRPASPTRAAALRCRCRPRGAAATLKTELIGAFNASNRARLPRGAARERYPA